MDLTSSIHEHYPLTMGWLIEIVKLINEFKIINGIQLFVIVKNYRRFICEIPRIYTYFSKIGPTRCI